MLNFCFDALFFPKINWSTDASITITTQAQKIVIVVNELENFNLEVYNMYYKNTYGNFSVGYNSIMIETYYGSIERY